jgi:cyclic lactone autoinducer peptide
MASMKLIKAIGTRSGEALAAVALKAGISSTKAICFLVFHQPKVPQGMDKFIEKRKQKSK